MYNEYLQDAVPEPIEQPPENRTPAARASPRAPVSLFCHPPGGGPPGAPTPSFFEEQKKNINLSHVVMGAKEL